MTLLLLAVVAVLGVEVAGIRREAGTVRRQTQLASSADGPSALLINLQNERSWAAVELIGQGDDAELIDLSTRQVEALGLLGREVGSTSLLSPGGIDQREEIASIAALRWRFVDLAAQIRDGSTGPYAGAGDEQLLVDYPAAVDDQGEAAMQGDFDTDAMLATLTPPPEDTYLGYRERVADVLVARADRIGHHRRHHRPLAISPTTAPGLGGVAVSGAR